ncbi:hypothetical protein JaAD80_15970 [Janthinobacterium sp. AD80]|nr:hypothetical protein JaAD80_15970 [Janthinobacterium sp. AD80]
MAKQKLLVIEDDPGLQKQLHWSFDAYEVLLAGEREAALALVRRHQPAVVTMDLGLPPDPDAPRKGWPPCSKSSRWRRTRKSSSSRATRSARMP